MRAILLLAFATSVCGVPFVPLSQCDVARITYYPSPYNTGACGFGELTGETGPGHLFGVAPNEAFYNTAEVCGECIEIVGPEGALRVMVTDLCPANENVLCRGDMVHFDLTEPAFPFVMDKTLGTGNVTWRFVECDVEGPIKFQLKTDSSSTWISMLIWNHRLGIRAAEYSQDGGSTWVPIERKSYNHFVWTPPSGQSEFTFPMQLRFRSTKGEYVQAVINTISEKGQVLLASGQFSKTGGGGGFEECCSPPDGFTDVYHDDNLLGVWNDWSYSSTIALDYSGVTAHGGSSCIRAALQGWGGLQIGSDIAAPRSQYSAISLWARTDAACSGCFSLQVGVYTSVSFGTSSGGVWEHVQISLEDLGVPTTAEDAIKTIAVKNGASTARTIYVDDIVLVKSASAPSLALCADDGTEPPSGTSSFDDEHDNPSSGGNGEEPTQLSSGSNSGSATQGGGGGGGGDDDNESGIDIAVVAATITWPALFVVIPPMLV